MRRFLTKPLQWKFAPRRISAAVFFLWIPLCLGAGCRGQAPRPPVILISIDTLRADHLGCYGYKRDTSPAIDALARDGILFSNAFAQAPYTLPSHMSILTGLYPLTHFCVAIDQKLDESRTTLAEILKGAGYETAAFVDAPFMSKKYGFDQGFDLYDEEGGGIEGVNRRVLPWLEERREKEFFLFYHVFDVHGPYRYPAPYETFFREKEKRRGKADLEFISRFAYHDYLGLNGVPDLSYILDAYDGGIRYVDGRLQVLFERLRTLNLYEESLICLLSDHGESLFEHNIYVGHGIFLFDSEVRIPIILKLPGNRASGERVESMVESVDVMPTILDVLGIDRPEMVQGRSLLSHFQKEEGEIIAYGISPNLSSLDRLCLFARSMRWKYITPAAKRAEEVAGETLRSKGESAAEAIRPFLRLGEQLYDLKEDPLEQKNVAPEHPGICRHFREKLDEWWRLNKEALKKNPVASNTIHLSPDFVRKLEELGYMKKE